MKISSNGIALIKRFEGCRLTAYKAVPTEKYYTIGFGHYSSNIKAGQKITQAQADQLLQDDLHAYENAVNGNVIVPLTQNQFDALVSLCYNIGAGAFQRSSLLLKLNRKDYVGASNEFLKWVHAGKIVLNGLVKRRKAEKELFDTHIPKPKPKPKPKEHIVNYTIKKGDSLTEIALDHHTTVERLLKLNPSIKNKDIIVNGKSIKVPKVY